VSRPVFVLTPLPGDEVVELSGPEGRHAATVRRIEVGEVIELTDGQGARRIGEVIAVAPEVLRVRCGPIEHFAVPDPRIVVVQALPKGDRAELAVELMTEVGVDEIVPWAAQRCVVQWRGERAAKSLARWERVGVEASKQSRRQRFPRIGPLSSTRDVAARLERAGAAIVLEAEGARPLTSVELPASGEIVIVVGPEGGISPAELDRFADVGAQPVRLGETVLRTSTAGAAAAVAISLRLGRW
jgi:16S rRNA (uracil1498-N3)-methyltransferase